MNVAAGVDGSAPVPIVVAVSDDHLDAVESVVERLRAAGMHVEETLAAIGAVTGSAASSSLSALQAVEGVEKVEVSRYVQIPPPDSDVQ